MHWFYAHLIAVLELGTYVAMVPVRICLSNRLTSGQHFQ